MNRGSVTMRAGLFLLIVLLPGLATAIELKIATQYPDGTSTIKALRDAGEQIGEATDGRVSLRIYPGGTMGDDRSVHRRIRVGQLHGGLAQLGAFAREYRDSQVLNLPLVFRDYGEVDHVREELDSEIRQGFRENGWHIFGPVDGGFAYIMSQEPVTSVDDFRERDLWLPANDPASEKAARVFGLSPVVLDVSNVLTSLQTGVIDSLVAPPVAALTLQWYSRVEYLTEMPLLYTWGLLAISDRHFSRISDEDQQVVREILDETFAELDRSERESNREALKAMENQGIELVRPDEDQLEEWRHYAERTTEELVEAGEVSEKMLERLNGLLEEYRGQ